LTKKLVKRRNEEGVRLDQEDGDEMTGNLQDGGDGDGSDREIDIEAPTPGKRKMDEARGSVRSLVSVAHLRDDEKD
jgi:hypothetical protein